MAIGRLLIADLHFCEADLDDADAMEREMVRAVETAGAVVLRTCFHRFRPHGVSGVIIISASHLTVHTYPEWSYAALDIFTCGKTVDPQIILELLLGFFRPQVIVPECLTRGQHVAEVEMDGV